MKSDVYVELSGEQYNIKSISDAARAIWKDSGNKMKHLETMELFFKPDEKKCYYVFNGETSGSFDV